MIIIRPVHMIVCSWGSGRYHVGTLSGLKGVILCFFTFWIFVSVYCVCLGIKRSTKLQISKSTPKGDISFKKKKNPFQELQRTARLDYKVVFLYLWYHKNKSRLRKSEWLAVGKCLVEHCTFQNRNLVRVFLYYCISEGNRLFSENFGCNFHFILHVMSDKAAFVSGALFCVQCYRGNLDLYHSNSTSRC